MRRDGSPPPQVKGLTLDTKFDAVDSQAGDVNLVVQASNVPGVNDALSLTPPTKSARRSSRFIQRGLFGDIGNAIEGAFDKFKSFDKNITKSLPPLDVNKNFPILDLSKSCPAVDGGPSFSAGLKADIDAKAHAVVTIGVAASGTIIPPKIKDFGVFAG